MVIMIKCQSLVFHSSLFRTTMSKPTKLSESFPAMFKLFKHKSSSLSSIQQEPSRNPTPSHALSLPSLAGRSATETVSLIMHNIATSVTVPNFYATPSNLETAPTSPSVTKDTVINALKFLLKISSDIPGLGVKAALSGLLTVIERVQVH